MRGARVRLFALARLTRLVLLALCLVTGARGAFAQAELVGTRAVGMGEARRAVATGSDALLLNPAGMSLIRGYAIEAQYGFSVEDLGHRVVLSIVDSITSRVAAGLFYSYVNTQPQVGFNWAGGLIQSERLSRSGHATGLALSLPLGQSVILGTAVKYLNFDTVAPLPMGTIPKELKLDAINGVTFDVGLLVRAGDKFHITAIGQNLWDHGSRETPLTLGLGVAVLPIPSLTIAFDSAVNFTGYRNYVIDQTAGTVATTSRVTARLGPGIEWAIANKVPVRIGVVHDTGLPATYLTAGVGFMSTQFGIDLSYRGKVQGGIENLLMLGLRFAVN